MPKIHARIKRVCGRMSLSLAFCIQLEGIETKINGWLQIGFRSKVPATASDPNKPTMILSGCCELQFSFMSACCNRVQTLDLHVDTSHGIVHLFQVKKYFRLYVKVIRVYAHSASVQFFINDLHANSSILSFVGWHQIKFGVCALDLDSQLDARIQKLVYRERRQTRMGIESVDRRGWV